MQVLQRLTLVGLALLLAGTTGCHQLSKQVRSEQTIEQQTNPVPPDFRQQTPQLQPVPQQLPPLPLPAPPSDSARRSTIGDDEFGWQAESVEVAERDAAEFFPAAEASRLIAERAEATAARLAEQGRTALDRRAERLAELPVIVPASSSLRRVSAETPVLLPVPK